MLFLGVILLKNKICCFAGHRDVYDTKTIISVLHNEVENLIINENIKEFWVGNYGSFDAIASKCVRTLKTKYKDVKLVLVIPYITKQLNEYKEQHYEKYDEILMEDIPPSTPRQLKIIKCNEYIVNEAEYLICYIRHTWGGAAKTFEYAQKRKIKIININDTLESRSMV